MTVDIYADEMIFVNFIANIIITEITKKLVRQKTGIMRQIATAFVFSVIYTFFVISDLRKYINIFTLLMLNTAELAILFRPVKFIHLIKYLIAFKLGTMGVNGCIFLLRGYLKNGFGYLILVISFCITYLSYVLLNILNRDREYYSVDIVCSNKIININALMDTGNSLVEPISNKPVIVAEYSALKSILPRKLVEIYENKKESNLMEIISAISEDSFRKSLRIIPFKSVDNEKGMMIGFVADSAIIENNIINKPVIGICRFNLSKNGLYSALISPQHLGGI